MSFTWLQMVKLTLLLMDHKFCSLCLFSQKAFWLQTALGESMESFHNKFIFFFLEKFLSVCPTNTDNELFHEDP